MNAGAVAGAMIAPAEEIAARAGALAALGMRSSASAVVAAVLTVLFVATNANAQQQPAPVDSAWAGIHTTLRSFYFNLAHNDWEALTADILAAKVVAHRPAPDALLAAAASSGSATGETVRCSSGPAPLVDQAAIMLEGDWAEVSVPRCGGADEFRLIRFEERWRIVYIYSRISSTPSIR